MVVGVVDVVWVVGLHPTYLVHELVRTHTAVHDGVDAKEARVAVLGVEGAKAGCGALAGDGGDERRGAVLATRGLGVPRTQQVSNHLIGGHWGVRAVHA